MSTSTARPAPPHADWRTPLCGVCGEDTDATETGSFECTDCEIVYPADPSKPGEWTEPDAPVCTAWCRPFAYSSEQRLRAVLFLCARREGHGTAGVVEHVGFQDGDSSSASVWPWRDVDLTGLVGQNQGYGPPPEVPCEPA